MFMKNIIKLSAAVHELSWSQRKRKLGRRQYTVGRYRAVSNKEMSVFRH